MNCESCQNNPASVHITEVVDYTTDPSTPLELSEKHLCEECADVGKLPMKPVIAQKGGINIWKLLKQSARRSRQVADQSCPQCSLSLREFRAGGRLGCPHCYDAFARHLTPLLHRMHNSVQHVGRRPGIDSDELERMQKERLLEERLASAVREEAYESAAALRDELEALREAAAESPELEPGASREARQQERVETAQLDFQGEVELPREDETA